MRDGIGAPDSEHRGEYIMPGLSNDAKSDAHGNILEFGIAGDLRKLLDYNLENYSLQQSDVYIVRYLSTNTTEVVVERDMNVLTLEEARANLAQVTTAIRDELVRWVDLDSFRRMLKT